MLGLGIGMLIVWIIAIVIYLWLAKWIYEDAKDRGESPELWLIIYLLTFLIGVIVWILVRPD